MVESQFFWKNQELLAPEKYGRGIALCLRACPALKDQTYYASVTSWIDRGILFPVHVVKTLRGTGLQKEFIYYGLRQVGGRLVRVASGGKAAGEARLLDSCNRSGLWEGKSWTQGL